jgi:formate dehydrogenase maturation protein FdhE
MTPSSVMLAQLYALRAHVEAVVLAAEAEAGMSQTPPREAGSCPRCGASPEQVSDTSTLDGTKRSRCQQCEHEWIRSQPEEIPA